MFKHGVSRGPEIRIGIELLRTALLNNPSTEINNPSGRIIIYGTILGAIYGRIYCAIYGTINLTIYLYGGGEGLLISLEGLLSNLE